MIIVVVFLIAMFASFGVGICITYLVLKKKHDVELTDRTAEAEDAGWHQGFSQGWDACKGDYTTVMSAYNHMMTREIPVVE